MYNSFVNAIIDIINKYQNSHNCFSEISVREIVPNEINHRKYTIISDGRFTFYVRGSRIRYIVRDFNGNKVDFSKWDDNVNQLIVVEMLYGM